MTDTAAVTPETNRENEIKVASRSDPTRLAGTISSALQEPGSRVKMRAIGAGAVNQATKAQSIARGYVAKRGLDLVTRPGMETTTDLTRPGTSGSDELSVVVWFVSVE